MLCCCIAPAMPPIVLLGLHPKGGHYIRRLFFSRPHEDSHRAPSSPWRGMNRHVFHTAATIQYTADVLLALYHVTEIRLFPQ
ncbi:hypothetical protein QQF64_019152 [Cirrhinus molitorella]|uniref:Secreted protein n=1 Tax=Cirrhinus molitorella TaxID=172907 RepID=A0ABR3LH12_9TELE